MAGGARSGVTFHVIPGSVADPRLILQTAAHPERFILEPAFLAGMSSLTPLILGKMNSGEIGHSLVSACDISYSERRISSGYRMRYIRVYGLVTQERPGLSGSQLQCN